MNERVDELADRSSGPIKIKEEERGLQSWPRQLIPWGRIAKNSFPRGGVNNVCVLLTRTRQQTKA